jgi:hypothetical protein
MPFALQSLIKPVAANYYWLLIIDGLGRRRTPIVIVTMGVWLGVLREKRVF